MDTRYGSNFCENRGPREDCFTDHDYLCKKCKKRYENGTANVSAFFVPCPRFDGSICLKPKTKYYLLYQYYGYTWWELVNKLIYGKSKFKSELVEKIRCKKIKRMLLSGLIFIPSDLILIICKFI